MRRKNRSNLRKHGISFETALQVFEDHQALSEQDRIVDDEERWQTIGAIGPLVVIVVHAWWEDNGEDVIRLISARRASSREKKSYETQQKPS